MSTPVEKVVEKAREEFQEISARQGAPEPPAQPLIAFEKARYEEVSRNTLRSNRIIAGLDDDVRANAFRVLRVRVLHKMLEEGWTALGVTSAAAGDGKTLMAVNLAVSIAMDINQSVLLVDLDLKCPSVHRAFGLDPSWGLSDYLSDQCELEACLIDPGVERLVVLPQVSSLQRSSEVLATPRARQLMRELKSRNRDLLVIYDMPPLLCSDDALVILPNLDASILVVQEGKSEENDIERALDLLKGSNWLGTVLNRSHRGDGHY